MRLTRGSYFNVNVIVFAIASLQNSSSEVPSFTFWNRNVFTLQCSFETVRCIHDVYRHEAE